MILDKDSLDSGMYSQITTEVHVFVILDTIINFKVSE